MGLLFPEVFIGFCYLVWFVVQEDFTFFDEDGAIAEFTNIAHVVRDENYGLAILDF